MFSCKLLYDHSSIAIILMGKRELIALLNVSSWCLVMVERLFLAVPRGCLQFVIVVFPDHTHLLFLNLLHRSLHLQAIMCGSRRGIGVPDPPPWKITSYMGFYRNRHLKPNPLEKVGPPPLTLEKVGPSETLDTFL